MSAKQYAPSHCPPSPISIQDMALLPVPETGSQKQDHVPPSLASCDKGHACRRPGKGCTPYTPFLYKGHNTPTSNPGVPEARPNSPNTELFGIVPGPLIPNSPGLGPSPPYPGLLGTGPGTLTPD